MSMKQRTLRRKNPVGRGGRDNKDDNSWSLMPSQYSDDGYTTASSSSSSSLSSSSSSSSLNLLQRTGRVSFDSKVQVRAVKAESVNDNDEDLWYSPQDLQEIKQSVVATIREMRKPSKTKQRGLCSRGLENVKSAEYNKERLQRRAQHYKVVAEQQQQLSSMARAAETASQTCRQVALDLASKDEAFVRTSLNLDELMETVQQEQQGCRDDRTMRRLHWTTATTATLDAPVWEPLKDQDTNENAAFSGSPTISSLVPSKAKQWVSSAMMRRSHSWRQKPSNDLPTVRA